MNCTCPGLPCRLTFYNRIGWSTSRGKKAETRIGLKSGILYNAETRKQDRNNTPQIFFLNFVYVKFRVILSSIWFFLFINFSNDAIFWKLMLEFWNVVNLDEGMEVPWMTSDAHKKVWTLAIVVIKEFQLHLSRPAQWNGCSKDENVDPATQLNLTNPFITVFCQELAVLYI